MAGTGADWSKKKVTSFYTKIITVFSSNAEFEDSLAYLSRLFKGAREHKLICTDTSPHVIAISFYCFIEGLMFCFLKHPGIINDSYLAKAISLFLQSLKAN